jgi:hypothetical protein
VKPDEILSHYGSRRKFHKETGIAANSLSNWIKWGRVPKETQYKIERITKGLFKTEWTGKDD